MTEEAIVDAKDATFVEPSKTRPKMKRAIIRFDGAKPVAIDLDRVTLVQLDGLRIIFDPHIYANPPFFDFDDKALCESAFEILLKIWASAAEIKES